MKTILFTAEELNSPAFLQQLGEKTQESLLHIPLEKTMYFTFEEERDLVNNSLDDYTFTIYGGLRNARYYVQYINEYNLQERVRRHIHLVTDATVQEYLESQSIPAILPREYATGIDILEFLLRISTQGKVLYPSTDQHTEEIPGLLKELHMGVTEFTVCRERSLTREELNRSRERIADRKPDSVIFHDRASVRRTRLAFPDLPLNRLHVISASRGVTEKLNSENIQEDQEAGGSWRSLAELLKE